MKPFLGPRRDFGALESRRKQAARLFGLGKIQAVVARTLQVSRQSVSRWYQQWKRAGLAGLRAAGRAGRKPRLTPSQLQQLDQQLRRGARPHGFRTDLWTLPRVARVIERQTDVSYHPGHVWRILRAMDWTLQRPARRAKERNELAIRRWVAQRWPVVKKTRGGATPGLSSRTRVGFPSDHPSAGRGRRAGKRRC
jgi:transposase